MKTGTVQWFNDAKGFGFIQPDDSSEPLFAHYSAIQCDGDRTLLPNTRVTYRLVNGYNGLQAMDIRPVASAA